MRLHLCLLLPFVLGSCISTSPRLAQKKKFDKIQKSINIWASSISNQTRDALDDFNNRKKLENGRIYGEFARNLKLSGKSLEQLETLAQKEDCVKTEDFIRDASSNEPLSHKDKNITMVFFICPDGTSIRVKPSGNPLSRYRPWPHSSKSLRYPADADATQFSNEALKIDNEGNAVPKWPRDLAPDIDPAWWAEDAHTDYIPRTP